MMARRRNYRAEAARRNELARQRGFASYYEERIARARRQHPGITRRAARGHATPGERAANRLERDLKKLPADSMIAFTGIDRQADGTWRRARFDVLNPDGTDQTYIVDGPALGRLPHIADAIGDSGISVLGAKYLAQMADSEQQELELDAEANRP